MTETCLYSSSVFAKKSLKVQSEDGIFLSLRAFSSEKNGPSGPFAHIGALHGPLGRSIDAGVARFRRQVQLPRLIPVGPEEIADRSFAGRLGILKRLARALRGERARGRAGHWTYSLNRHIGLLQAFKAERAALRMCVAENRRPTGVCSRVGEIQQSMPAMPGSGIA